MASDQCNAIACEKSENAQNDPNAAGLNNATPDFLVGFGYASRFNGLFGK